MFRIMSRTFVFVRRQSAVHSSPHALGLQVRAFLAIQIDQAAEKVQCSSTQALQLKEKGRDVYVWM